VSILKNLKPGENSLVESSQDKFKALLEKNGLEIKPVLLDTLWVNITSLCNQSCRHCHVGGSPERNEKMDPATIDRCLEILSANRGIANLDITGGAPELHPQFEYFVRAGRRLGKNVKVRHNLSVIIDGNPVTGEGREQLPGFFAENKVHVLASLPHYDEEATDAVRGMGVFKKSLKALAMLNDAGYGREGKGLEMDIVTNIEGPITSVESARLEEEFRRELMSRFGIVFNRLLCVTNMPINRYLRLLEEDGGQAGYMERITSSFDPGALDKLVCRTLVSVGYDGRIYDCDFNQALGLQVSAPAKMNVFNFNLEALLNRRIQVGNHCFGCTAGGGSS
jgi:radical SAM/Cys-rich protein